MTDRMHARRSLLTRIRDLSLFWKLLLPFLALIVILGVAGSLLIVRDLSTRARTTVNEELLERSLETRSVLRDRELYLLEASNFAANLQDMAQAIERRNAGDVADLLRSVLALKGDLALVVAIDRRGDEIIGVTPKAAGRASRSADRARWRSEGFVAQALSDATGAKRTGIVTVDGSRLLGIAAPVCTGRDRCSSVGAIVAAIDVREELAEILRVSGSSGGAAIYGTDGSVMISVGEIAAGSPPEGSADRLLRRTETIRGNEFATVYAPFEVQDSRLGTVAVTIPTEAAFASARDAGVRLIIVLVLATAGIIAIGALLSRFILAQLRPLSEVNRALGTGDLSARAPVLSRDELGLLAEGLNSMADQLQAGVDTLEMRVDERTEEIRRLLQERTDFFTALSHEFRTPLAAVINEARMLRDPSYRKTRSWTAEASKNIEESAEQALSLVNDILEVARSQAGQLDVHLEDVRLSDVVGELRSTIQALGKGSDLRVDIAVPKDLPAVRADPAGLKKIILNLVDNAMKYTASGGEIHVSAATNNGAVELAVSDTGVGIPAEVGERIFEPFYRVADVEPHRGRPSSGLGLALTRRLVSAHGGRISFTSMPGAGSTFVVSLPYARADTSGERGNASRSSSR